MGRYSQQRVIVQSAHPIMQTNTNKSIRERKLYINLFTNKAIPSF